MAPKTSGRFCVFGPFVINLEPVDILTHKDGDKLSAIYGRQFANESP